MPNDIKNISENEVSFPGKDNLYGVRPQIIRGCPKCNPNAQVQVLSGWEGTTCYIKFRCPMCKTEACFKQDAPRSKPQWALSWWQKDAFEPKFINIWYTYKGENHAKEKEKRKEIDYQKAPEVLSRVQVGENYANSKIQTGLIRKGDRLLPEPRRLKKEVQIESGKSDQIEEEKKEVNKGLTTISYWVSSVFSFLKRI